MKIRTVKNNERVLYPLAKSWIRFVTRLFDTIMTFIIAIGIYFLVNSVDSSASFGTIALISVIAMIILMFIYYILVAYFTKGYTLFRWIFKIKLIELISLKKYFLHLILHDLFLWIHFAIITLIYAIITISQPVNNQQMFFMDLYNFASLNVSNIYAIVFKILYTICSIVSIVFLIYTFTHSGKRSLQDLISWTAMISMNKGTPQNKNKNFAPSTWKPKTNFHLPGDIDLTTIEKKNIKNGN